MFFAVLFSEKKLSPAKAIEFAGIIGTVKFNIKKQAFQLIRNDFFVRNKKSKIFLQKIAKI